MPNIVRANDDDDALGAANLLGGVVRDMVIKTSFKHRLNAKTYLKCRTSERFNKIV